MKNKTFSIIFMTCLVMTGGYYQDSVTAGNEDSKTKPVLNIYLPRTAEVKDHAMSLADICVIRGDGSLKAIAEKLQMGRISFPGQKVAVTKTMILSRLVCSGIEASEITLTGAEEVVASLEHKTIAGTDFLSQGNEFLVKNPPAGQACQWSPTRIPEDFIIPGCPNDIQLSVSAPKITSRNYIKTQIDIIADGKKVGSREIVYRLQFKCKTVVAATNIQAGEVITTDNVRIEEIISNSQQDTSFTTPYGQIAARDIPAKTVIRNNMVTNPKQQVVVKREQSVRVKIDRPGIVATANGTAMQDGKAGEFIKVKMQITKDSQRVIFAKVLENGTLEPVF